MAIMLWSGCAGPRQVREVRVNAIQVSATSIPQLTGVRALAAGMVLFLHLDQNFGNQLGRWLAPVEQGALGVDIFFILSGFIIAHVYGDGDATRSRRGYLRFLWRRFARLYPIHLATLAALIAMVGARGLLDTNFWRLDQLPMHLLMLHAWVDEVSWNLPAWSISAEWAAYVLFPLAAALVLRPATLWLPAISAIALLAAFQAYVVGEVGVGRSFIGWAAALRIGAEFFLGVLTFRLASAVRPGCRWGGVALACLVTAFLVSAVPTLQVLLFAAAIGALSRSEGPVRAFFASRPAVALGEISYSVYMVHFPVIKVIHNVNAWLGTERPEPWLAHGLVLAWAVAIVALAAIAYRFVERPARQWCRDREPVLFAKSHPTRREPDPADGRPFR